MEESVKIDDLFKKSWDMFSSKFWTLASIGALFGFLPVFIFSILERQGLSAVSHPLTLASMINEMWILSPWIFTIALASIFLNVSIIYFLNNKKEGKDISFGESLKGGWSFYGKGLILGFLLFVFLVPLYFLLLVPGLMFQIYWTFAFYILVAENTSAMGAIRRSYEIVKGRWWHVLWFVAILALVVGLINSLLSMAFVMLGVVGIFLKNILSTLTGIFTLIFLNNFYLVLKKSKA